MGVAHTVRGAGGISEHLILWPVLHVAGTHGNPGDTGCASHFGNLTNFKILKEPLLLQKQAIPQQKALDLSFNLTP